MSGTSEYALYGKEEATTYGVYFGGALRVLRYAGWSVQENIAYVQSAEINPSREPQDQIKSETRVTGEIRGELSYDANFIRLLNTLLLYTVNPTGSNTNTITTFALSQVTNAFDDSTATVRPCSGDWMWIGGTAAQGDAGKGLIVKAAVGYISGAFAVYNATLAVGDAVTGVTSGATGVILAINTGGLTYTVQVTLGVFVAGETLRKTSTFSTPGANEVTVITITASGAILSGKKIVTEAAGLSITAKILGTVYPGSTTLGRSWTFEGVQGDLANVFEVVYGAYLVSGTFTIPAKGKITWQIQAKGKNKVNNTATIGSGTPTAAGTLSVMTCEANVYGILMGGAEGPTMALTNTDASATTVCTTATPHGLQTDDLIVISLNADTDNNRNWLVTRTGLLTFTLQGSSAQTAESGANAGVFRKLKTRKAVVDCGFTINNQMLEETDVGTPGIVAQPVGTLSITGNANIYFIGLGETNHYHDDEYYGIAHVFQDTSDYKLIYVFECPRIKYIQNQTPVDANNESRTNAIQWAASIDPTEQHALRVCY